MTNIISLSGGKDSTAEELDERFRKEENYYQLEL